MPPGPAGRPIVVVVPSGDPDVHPPPAARPLAGLARLDRIRAAAERAGLATVLLTPLAAEAGCPPPEPIPADAAAGPGPAPRRRVLLLADHVIPRVAWLRRLAEMPVEAGRLYVDDAADGPAVALVEAAEPEPVLALATRHGTLRATLTALRQRLPATAGGFDGEGRFVLRRPEDAEAAEDWLLRGLLREHEGFMSRHLERRISLTLTRRLARHPVTPNAMTMVSLAIGLASTPFFLSASSAWQVAGALLLLTHSILDGCDGELARLKFLESRTGAILDFWGDNAVHVLLFSCLAIGWSRASGSPWPLVLGGITVGSTASAAWALHAGWTGRRPDPGAPRSRGGRLVDALANRDFVYVLLALAVAGQAGWFLVPGAVGTPAFLVLALARQERRPPTAGR